MLKTMNDGFTDDEGTELGIVSGEGSSVTVLQMSYGDDTLYMDFDVDALELLIDTLEIHRDHLLKDIQEG